METAYQLVRYGDIVAFVVLAVILFRKWRARQDEPSRWAFLTFASLASVAVAGALLDAFFEDSRNAVLDYIETLVIAVLLLFPYFLFRLATSFSDKGNELADRGATFLTAAVVAWAIILPRFPEPEEPRSLGITLFVFAILLQWVLLSGFVAVRFWRAGADQPDVARRRMRMLSAAATSMSLAIVVSGTDTGEREIGVDLAIQSVVLVAVIAFFLGFSPPAWLRAFWRREAQTQVRLAAMNSLSAGSREEIVQSVLPHAAAIVGGQGIAMLTSSGELLGSYGFDEQELRNIDPREELDPKRYVKLDYPFGSLILRATKHTPFFGQDDISLLGATGAVANLALKRLDAVETERKLGEARLRRRQALEINDNIVQRLAVAHYSFELGQIEEGKKAMEAALRAAQRTISDLVGELSADPEEDSPLTRLVAASGDPTTTSGDAVLPPTPDPDPESSRPN